MASLLSLSSDLLSRCNAFNRLPAFVHSVYIWSLKFNSLSTATPRIIILSVELTWVSFMTRPSSASNVLVYTFDNSMAWNLDGFAIREFALNQSSKLLISWNRTWRIYSTEEPAQDITLSSAQLNNEHFSEKKKISLIKILNKRGPSIEPCGTPRSTSSQLLLWSHMLTLCLCLCR